MFSAKTWSIWGSVCKGLHGGETAWVRHAAGEPSRDWVLKATLRSLKFIPQAVQVLQGFKQRNGVMRSATETDLLGSLRRN